MSKTHHKITQIKIKTQNIKINVSSKFKPVLKLFFLSKKRNRKKHSLKNVPLKISLLKVMIEITKLLESLSLIEIKLK